MHRIVSIVLVELLIVDGLITMYSHIANGTACTHLMCMLEHIGMCRRSRAAPIYLIPSNLC